ncbi:NGO1151 family protein, partial [Kingella kingae]
MENFENNLDYLEESVAALRMQNRVLAAALKGFLRALPQD